MSHMPTVRQIVESWIHVSPDRLSSSPGELGQAATARGNYLGYDNSDPAARGKAIYTEPQNLPTAVASILNHVQNRANFHPASMPADELIKRLGPYIAEINRIPFFTQTFSSKDYNELIDQIVIQRSSTPALRPSTCIMERTENRRCRRRHTRCK